jgi:hypothetical protein
MHLGGRRGNWTELHTCAHTTTGGFLCWVRLVGFCQGEGEDTAGSLFFSLPFAAGHYFFSLWVGVCVRGV